MTMWARNDPHVDPFESMPTKWTKMLHISMVFKWMLISTCFKQQQKNYIEGI